MRQQSEALYQALLLALAKTARVERFEDLSQTRGDGTEAHSKVLTPASKRAEKELSAIVYSHFPFPTCPLT